MKMTGVDCRGWASMQACGNKAWDPQASLRSPGNWHGWGDTSQVLIPSAFLFPLPVSLLHPSEAFPCLTDTGRAYWARLEGRGKHLHTHGLPCGLPHQVIWRWHALERKRISESKPVPEDPTWPAHSWSSRGNWCWQVSACFCFCSLDGLSVLHHPCPQLRPGLFPMVHPPPSLPPLWALMCSHFQLNWSETSYLCRATFIYISLIQARTSWLHVCSDTLSGWLSLPLGHAGHCHILPALPSECLQAP